MLFEMRVTKDLRTAYNSCRTYRKKLFRTIKAWSHIPEPSIRLLVLFVAVSTT